MFAEGNRVARSIGDRGQPDRRLAQKRPIHEGVELGKLPPGSQVAGVAGVVHRERAGVVEIAVGQGLGTVRCRRRSGHQSELMPVAETVALIAVKMFTWKFIAS